MFLIRVHAYVVLKQWSKAVDDWSTLLKENRYNPSFCYDRGLAALYCGRYDLAIDDLMIAVRKSRDALRVRKKLRTLLSIARERIAFHNINQDNLKEEEKGMVAVKLSQTMRNELQKSYRDNIADITKLTQSDCYSKELNELDKIRLSECTIFFFEFLFSLLTMHCIVLQRQTEITAAPIINGIITIHITLNDFLPPIPPKTRVEKHKEEEEETKRKQHIDDKNVKMDQSKTQRTSMEYYVKNKCIHWRCITEQDIHRKLKEFETSFQLAFDQFDFSTIFPKLL